MQAVIGRARRVIDKPIALLLQGESGVGKELFARACHGSGERRSRPFVAVNCAALPETLIEAELFGYRPGAFTGAGRDGAPGRIREADGGTLFLDEIGDMPLAMQARLLRVLQERQVTPLGGGKPVRGRFPADLRDPPPAARPRSMPAASAKTCTTASTACRCSCRRCASAATSARWSPRCCARWRLDARCSSRPRSRPRSRATPGPATCASSANALRTACALVGDDEGAIGWAHLPDDLAEQLVPPLRPARGRGCRDPTCGCRPDAACSRRCGRSNGNLSEAARRLGISRNTLYRKLRQLEQA